MKQRNLTIQAYSSSEEASSAEYARRSSQTPQQRMAEFSILQTRCWGEKWTNSKIAPIVSFEKLAW